ncbi:MetQ/NlpA family ABC transporter substrate-binding protein [Clostridium sp.]|uniref:MetQ/NlpA family ABC transporter substrate-binding protein n=1 Tax=Clostridium sp. TaxID=1506 RepID=UPI002FCC59E0
MVLWGPFILWKSIDEFPNGAVIGVSNDKSNLGIALKMLQKVGFITLGEKTGNFYTEVDIVKNPKNIKLVMSETINVAKSIDDADAVISFAFYAVRAGGVDAGDFLAENDTDKEECPVGIVVREEDKDTEWAKYIAENLVKDKWTQKVDESYPPGCYPYYK